MLGCSKHMLLSLSYDDDCMSAYSSLMTLTHESESEADSEFQF